MTLITGPEQCGHRTFMIVPQGTWSYWDNTFVKCADQLGVAEGFVLICSRLGGDAGLADARILEQRLVTGLHVGHILTPEKPDAL